VKVIAIEPTSKSNASIVQSQLEKAAEVTGYPRLIVRDDGTDLKKGVNQFAALHPGTLSLYDIKHMAARILKRELESNATWQEFSKHLDLARKQTHQTPLAHLAPPTVQTQARYMNIGKLIGWGVNTRAYIDHPQLPQDANERWGKISITFGWLREYDTPLQEWNNVMQVVDNTLIAVRQDGYYRGADEAAAATLAKWRYTQRLNEVADQLVEFVGTQSRQRGGRASDWMYGTTRSLIGKEASGR
jgi:hypothetical protein